jgi:CRISPR-associated protein Cmr6
MKRRRSGRDRKGSSQAQKRPLRLPLPGPTSDVVERYIVACQNPGLVYDRYVKYLHRGDDWSLTPNTRARPREENPKQEALAATIAAQNRLSSFVNLWQGFQERWECITNEALTFQANPAWRFVSGLGRGGPLEVGFTFHRIYGFPTIPGSSLKGLARMKALVELSERLSRPLGDLNWLDLPKETDFEQKLVACLPHSDTETQRLARWFRLIFGTTKRAGAVVFFDAIPVNPPQLEPDVMTPHFSDYYQDGNKPPADWYNPKPVPFLTVGKDTRFRFAVGWRGEKDGEAHQQARRWLEEGLQELGIGAKTAAGYGYFEEVK